jgi:hypothetical protein
MGQLALGVSAKSFTAKDAEAAKEQKSFTAKAAKNAKERKSLTAKEIIIRSKSISQGRQGTAPRAVSKRAYGNIGAIPSVFDRNR